MKHVPITTALMFAGLFSMSAAANAAILIEASPSGTGTNLLFQNITGNDSNLVTADTSNGSGNINVTMTSSTDSLHVGSSGGQSNITAVDGLLNQFTYRLTDLTQGFTTGVYNIDPVNNDPDDFVTVSALGSSGTTYTLADVEIKNGSNFFTISASGGEVIKSISFTVFNGGAQEVQQIRLEGSGTIPDPNDPPGAVPEVSTWGMMLLGFAGVGFMSYRRRRGNRTLRVVA